MGSLPSLPAPVRAGQPITAAAFNRLLEAVKMATVINGVGVRVSRTMQGTVVSAVIQKPVAGGAGGSVQHPFQIYDTTSGGTLQCMVRYGQVNNEIPDNYTSNLSLTDDATTVIYLTCTLNTDGELTDLDLGAASSLPSDTDTAAYKLVGRVTCADGVVTAIEQGVTHSLEFRCCDRVVDGETITERGTYHFWGV